MRLPSPHPSMPKTVALIVLLASGVAFAGGPDFVWVLLHTKDDSVTMSGQMSHIHEAKKLRKGTEPLFWFKRGSSAWVIRDAATVAQIDALFAPQAALGQKQAELGQKQAAIGAKQANIGAKQAKIGMQLARARDDKTRAALEAQMEKLEKEMQALSAEQEPLSAEQEKLGEEQEALAAKAEARLPEVVEDAIAKKLAVPVK